MVVTSPSFQCAGFRSPSTFSGAITSPLNFAAFFEHGLGRVEAGVLEAGQLRDLVDIGEFVDDEQHVLDGGGVAHSRFPEMQSEKGRGQDRMHVCRR